jgi:hypothetical protein
VGSSHQGLKLTPYLLYPIAVCLMTLVVGGLAIRETKNHKIDTPIH